MQSQTRLRVIVHDMYGVLHRLTENMGSVCPGPRVTATYYIQTDSARCRGWARLQGKDWASFSKDSSPRVAARRGRRRISAQRQRSKGGRKEEAKRAFDVCSTVLPDLETGRKEMKTGRGPSAFTHLAVAF